MTFFYPGMTPAQDAGRTFVVYETESRKYEKLNDSNRVFNNGSIQHANAGPAGGNQP